MKVFIVVRPFTSNGFFFAPGDIVTDTTNIRFPRMKVSEGKLFEVDTDNLDIYKAKIEHLEAKTGREIFPQLAPKTVTPAKPLSTAKVSPVTKSTTAPISK